jgi:hypothetical protein
MVSHGNLIIWNGSSSSDRIDMGMFPPSNGKEMRGVEELPAYMLTLGKTDGNIMQHVTSQSMTSEGKGTPTIRSRGLGPHTLLLGTNMGGMMLAPNILEMGGIVLGVVNMGGLTPPVDINMGV